MKTSPVSFGSFMVFTIKDNKPKAAIPDFMKLAFNNNSNLKNYNLKEVVNATEKIDGTVYNAAKNFAESLDKKYKNRLPKGSKDVILTKVDFYVNPSDVEKRYFITAATNNDEARIHNILSSSNQFFSAKFGPKK